MVPVETNNSNIPVTERRITKKLKKAIDLIIINNLDYKSAAESSGYHYNSLIRALRLPHVIEYKEAISQEYFSDSKLLARNTIIELCKSAKSDDVRLRAARTILELEGKKDDNNSANMGNVTIIIHNSDSQLTTNQQTIEAISTEYKEL